MQIPKMAGKAKGDELPESHRMTETHQLLVGEWPEWASPLFQWSESPFLGNEEMSWTDLSEREKYVSLRRTTSVLFIGLMAWPRSCYFEIGSAGEFKAFKCLVLRKGIVSLGNAHEVIWTSKKGIISLVKCKRSYSNLEKWSNPSCNS